MDLGASLSAKLEPFLLMAKSVKGAAAAKLIQDATSAPGVFVFSELLELPNIQELENNEQHAKFLSLLKLFSYGTFQDYIQNKDAYPSLNAVQSKKLKYLSIVTLATERRILPYADLMKSLDMTNVRELEDLIIDAIYVDILRGKLDQKQEQLQVEYTMGRDLEPGKLESVLLALQNWASTASDVLTTLDSKIISISNEAAAAKARKQEHETHLQQILKEVYDKQKEKGLGGGGNMMNRRQQAGHQEKDAMDVDEPSEVSKSKNRKSSQEATSKPLRKRSKF